MCGFCGGMGLDRIFRGAEEKLAFDRVGAPLARLLFARVGVWVVWGAWFYAALRMTRKRAGNGKSMGWSFYFPPVAMRLRWMEHLGD
jgi:hypothetical protein